MPPAWPLAAGWLFSIAVVALIGLALAQAERWTEIQIVRFAVVFFALFGVGFLLSSYSPEHPLVFSLPRPGCSQGAPLVPAFRIHHRGRTQGRRLAVSGTRGRGRSVFVAPLACPKPVGGSGGHRVGSLD